MSDRTGDQIAEHLHPEIFRSRYYLKIKTGLSQSALDFHLQEMFEAGIVERELFKSSPSRGRAEHAYRFKN